MTKKTWEISGYDGGEVIFVKEVLLQCFPENRIQELLKVLAAKAGLSFEEIIGAYATRKSIIYNQLLVVQKEGLFPAYSSGENPYFAARVVRRK